MSKSKVVRIKEESVQALTKIDKDINVAIKLLLAEGEGSGNDKKILSKLDEISTELTELTYALKGR